MRRGFPIGFPALAALVVLSGLWIVLIVATRALLGQVDEMFRRVLIEGLAFSTIGSTLVLLWTTELGAAGALPPPNARDAYFLLVAFSLVGGMLSWARYK